MPGKKLWQPFFQEHCKGFVQGIEQMHRRKHTLRSLEGSTTRGRFVWLRVPGQQIPENGAARCLTLVHHLPGTVTHRHKGMPNWRPDLLMIVPYRQGDVTGIHA